MKVKYTSLGIYKRHGLKRSAITLVSENGVLYPIAYLQKEKFGDWLAELLKNGSVTIKDGEIVDDDG